MKYYELDKKEEEVLQDFEKGKFKSVSSLKSAKDKYREYSRATLNKTRNINIRLSDKDLQKIKVRAAVQGIPYQTLVTSVIHQYANSKAKERVR